MTLSVLVVDDNHDNVALCREILAKRSCDVDFAYDGPTALQLLEQKRFDVILLDVMMPRMDGLQVLERIRAIPGLANTPVILVTAKTQDEDVLVGYREGADYYITKPFTPRQLMYGIGLVLGREVA